MAEIATDEVPSFMDMSDDPNSVVLQKTLTDNENTNKPAEGRKKKKANNERIRCPECERYTTQTTEQMQRHIRKAHRGQNPFQCYMCEYSTYNNAVFAEHIRVHQGIKPFKCAHCDYASASKKNAKKHELIHRLDNPLRCKICGFISRHNKGLQSHIKSKHTDAEPITCSLCKRTFENTQKYQSHKSHLHKCKLCSFKVCSKKLVRNHMSEFHNQSAPVRRVDVLFKCALCKWSSNVRPRILLHLIHHPSQTVDKAIDITILKQMEIMK